MHLPMRGAFQAHSPRIAFPYRFLPDSPQAGQKAPCPHTGQAALTARHKGKPPA